MHARKLENAVEDQGYSLFYKVQHLMPWTSTNALSWHPFPRAFRTLTILPATESDSAMSYEFWGNSAPFFFEYKRRVLKTDKKYGVQPSFSRPLRGCII